MATSHSGFFVSHPNILSFRMAYLYMLRGSGGRFYIGATEDLTTRLARHNTGMGHSTKRAWFAPRTGGESVRSNNERSPGGRKNAQKVEESGKMYGISARLMNPLRGWHFFVSCLAKMSLDCDLQFQRACSSAVRAGDS
ncbi:MAG: GIY-YIG nuclease family protein [Verrucomicrobiales bacterium]